MGRISEKLVGGGGRLSKKADISTLAGIKQYAEQSGVDVAEEKPKLSVLQRLSSGLGAFNPAQAISTGIEKGIGAGIAEYPKSIIKGVGSAITGTDYQPERKYFKDIAEDAGIENGIAKWGIGFAGDVLLDPTTYFGGAILKGVTAPIKGASKLAVKGVGKVSPEIVQGGELIGKGLQDALGTALQYGYKSTKGAKEDVLSFLSKSQKARIGIAASNLDRLGTGTLSKAQQTELAVKMLAGKSAERFAREAEVGVAGEIGRKTALEGTTPEVAGVIGQQIERSKKFSKGITDNPYETYFPSIRTDKIAKMLTEGGGFKVGSEGYRKQFKDLLTNDKLEMNPAKAFFTRESQIVNDKITKDFLNGFVKKYGKGLDDFESVDEATKAGYQLIKDKGMFGKELGYVPEFDAKLIRNSIGTEFQTINMLAKATGFDAVTSLFKRSVTGLFAPFHVRNFASGMMQNYEVLGKAALNPKNIQMGQKIAYLIGKNEKFPTDIIKVAGKDMKFSDVIKPFSERFSGDTFYNTDFDSALNAGKQLKQAMPLFSKKYIKEHLLETAKTAGLGTEAIPFKTARAIGQYIEHQQKATAYITALGQGRSIQEALSLAEKSGFDYRALTQFESQIMRRIIPFYSFARKNIPLQLSTLGESPERVNHILRFFGNMGDTPTAEELQNLPGFIRESIGVKLEDTPEGLKQYISSFGTPIEAFTQLFGSNPVLRAISMTNPLIKAPTEIGIGKDSFRQRDLKDVYDAKEYRSAPQAIKDLLDIQEVKKPIYSTDRKGKQVVVGTKTQYVADPVKLLIARSLFTSRGVTYLDQVFNNDVSGMIKAIKTTTGIKPQTVDIEAQKYFNEKEQKREIEDQLIREGKLKEFTQTYIPK